MYISFSYNMSTKLGCRRGAIPHAILTRRPLRDGAKSSYRRSGRARTVVDPPAIRALTTLGYLVHFLPLFFFSPTRSYVVRLRRDDGASSAKTISCDLAPHIEIQSIRLGGVHCFF